MAIQRSNPLAAPGLNIEFTPEIARQADELFQRVRDTEQELHPWLQKQRRLTDLRYGHSRRRKVPWRGAANTSTKLIDGMIRRWRPGIVSLATDADPIVSMDPRSADDFDAAREAEQFMTAMFQDKMATEVELINLADNLAHRGMAYSREGWDYRTRKESRVVSVAELFPNGIDAFIASNPQEDPTDSIADILEEQYGLDGGDPVDGPSVDAAVTDILSGAEYTTLRYRRIESDRPAWQSLDPIDVIAPPDEDPEDAEFFCIIHRLSADQVRRMAVDDGVDSGAANRAAESAGSDRDKEGAQDWLRQEIRDILRRKRRTTPNQADKRIVVWEIYAKLDIDGDGLLERVHLWYAPGPREILSFRHYALPFETWPVTCYQYSGDAVRPIDSRGLTEMLADHQRIENEFKNARLNASQILLSPVFKRRENGVDPDSIDWRPGGLVTVRSMEDFQPVLSDLRILPALIQEEQVNRRDAETYVGIFDATLTSLQQTRERRTAAEVNAIQGVSASIFGLDAKMFQAPFSRSLTKVWNLYLELGPDEMFVRIRGKQFPQRVLKHEIGRNFDIKASGTPANTNRAFQLQNIQQAMQVFLTPGVLETGVVDVTELLQMWLKLLDYRMSEKIINSAEEAGAIRTVSQASQQLGGPPLV